MSSSSRRLDEPTSAGVQGNTVTGHAGGVAQRKAAQRRKLGQHATPRELPKKSGYLLKKGPLKVTSAWADGTRACVPDTSDVSQDRGCVA